MLRQRARYGHCRKHDVLKLFCILLRSNSNTLHYSRKDDDQEPIRAASSCEAVRNCSGGRGTWLHAP